MSIVDLGGTPEFWETWANAFDWSRTQVTCINLTPYQSNRVECITADATRLTGIRDQSYDIAFSNSVIEHVGREAMPAFASEASRVADRLYIQTPDYWFPIEAHARIPAFHWLPRCARATMLRARKWGYLPQAYTWREAFQTVRENDLLTASDMRRLFPDAQIIRERFMGFGKSLLAVR